MANLPAKLYKYESFSPQSLENLKAHRIYFGSPLGFNDIYDCAVNPVVLKPTLVEAEFIRQHYLRIEKTPNEIKRRFAEVPANELQEMVQRSGIGAIESAVARFLKERGVSCFSECNDDLLMWGHYGGKYKGFCLEFSTQEMPFSQAKKVNYCDHIPSTSVVPFLIGSGMNIVENFFCIKSASWAYEKEWRAIHNVAGTLFGYEAGALTGVYFGPEVSQEGLEIIALIIQGQNPDVKLYRGERSKTEFKIVFNEFEYINHIEAKTMGLR